MTDFTKLSPENLARVTTRDGQKVEIITTKGRSPCPVAGYIGELAEVREWHADGAYLSPCDGHPYDLILPPAPRVYYANLYPAGVSSYMSIDDARANRGLFWLALCKITDDGVSATIEVIERKRGA
jgi:hypothetical protein